jgi:phospholipase C
MEDIEHIVYLMLENRSLDNALGWLYENDSPDYFIPSNNQTAYNGLQPDFNNPDTNGNPVYVSKIQLDEGQSIPSVDPHEDFGHVKRQVINNMSGFYLDFTTTGSANPAEIMKGYTLFSLPVLNGLAKQFAVSDTYFSSIPTQTNCNRAFSLTGNSIGSYHNWPNQHTRTAMVNNYWEKEATDAGDPYVFTERSIWGVLNDNGHSSENDWLVFYNQTWPGIWPYEGSYCFTQDLLYPTLEDQTNHFKDINKFFSMAAAGHLPTFSYLEPTWYEEMTIDGITIGQNGSDYHPPANVGCGERCLHSVYNALKRNTEAWKKTLLIINFDEHGGTYDHVEPPQNVKAPWNNPREGTDPPYDYDIEFSYTRLGVRVPLILISPLIKKKTIIRAEGDIPFDHTSVIATILNRFGISKDKWKLGSRTANAPTFENVITLAPQNARTDVEIPAPIATDCVSDMAMPPNDLQWMIMHRMFSRIIRQHRLPAARFNELYQIHFSNIETITQMNEKAKIILAQLYEERNTN